MKKTLFILLSIIVANATAQDLYDIENVTLIELTFEDSNWDQQMDQNYSNGNSDRLLASCLVNGAEFDSVGVKYKGNSTYNANNAKNPLNIKLNYTIGNQDYDGFYTLKLSNGDKDPSFVREVLSYEITRKYMHGPLSNYAKVYINGDYYGLFSSSESINKKFVSEKFLSDEDNPLFKCNPESTFNGGSSLEYEGTNEASYYDYYELQTDDGWDEMITLTNAIANDQQNVENVLDIDRAIWMVSLDNILVNLDSYIGPFKQNYYLYYDDNNRWNAIKWDYNESFGRFGGGGPGSPASNTFDMDIFLNEGDNSYPLTELIYDNDRYRKMYIAHCKTILEENFADNGYLQRAQAMQATMQNAHETDPSPFVSFAQAQQNLTQSVNTGGGGPGGGNTVGITELMDARYTYLMAQSEFTATGPTISTIASDPSIVLANTSVNISASISDATYAYLGYRDNLANKFTKLEMLDDGNHGDGAAGDGVYGATISVNAADVQYYIYADNANAGKFSPVRAEHEFHTLLVGGDVVLNELMASNSTTAEDQDGESDDWIELFNRTSSSVDLTGFFLSDNEDNLDKWEFPAGTSIDANGYLIVWADKDTLQTGLHTNFKLSSSGEMVILSDGNSEFQRVVFGAQTTDMGYARVPNGTGAFAIQFPTFASNNNNGTGISESELSPLEIYPNPTSDFVHFNLENGNFKNEFLHVFDIAGQLVFETPLIQQNRIQIRSWAPGTYILRTSSGRVAKLVKQ
ncbi:MAG: CotH kinase family protein [Flavobacteriales bacterium]